MSSFQFLSSPPPHQDSPVAVHDGVEPMRDGHNGALSKLLPDRRLPTTNKMLIRTTPDAQKRSYLNQVVRFQIDGGRGFVQHQHLRLPEQSAGQTNQLPLAHAQVLSSFRDFVFQSGGQRRDERFQMSVFQSSPHVLVRVLVERVEVHAQRTGEEDWILWPNPPIQIQFSLDFRRASASVDVYLRNDGEPRAEGVQAQISDVDAVDEDGASSRLDDAEQAQSQRGFAGARSSDDAHLDKSDS